MYVLTLSFLIFVALKVALIHYRLIQFGGLETRLKNYIRFFHERGDVVHVLCAKYNPIIELPKDVKVVQLGAGLLPKPFRQGRFDARLGRYMKRHRYDFSLSLGRTSHQQFILCPGNHLGYLHKMNNKPASINDLEQIRMDRRGFHHSQIIFAASEMIRNELISLYHVHPDKVKILYPPLNTTNYTTPTREEKRSARLALNWDTNHRFFLFVSTGHERKGLPLLLSIFEKLTDTNNHLIIMGLPEVHSSLPNVHYAGYQSNPRPYYLAADALLHPSVYEPYGQIVAESLASHTPVIISDQVGASELVNEMEGIILPPKSADKWEETIREFNPHNFAISPTFAFDKKITLSHHMQKMLEWANMK